MKRKKLTIILAAALAAALAMAQGVPQHVFCSVDDSSAMWTGQTAYQNGHSFYRFRCIQQHEFWVRGS
jgi:hypothetical protein